MTSIRRRSRSNSNNIWNQISQKRYEIERKLDRKSCMGYRIVKKMTWRSKVEYLGNGTIKRASVNRRLWCRMSQKHVEMKNVNWSWIGNYNMGFQTAKIWLTWVDLWRSKVKFELSKFRSQTIHSFNFECILFKDEIINLIGILLYPNHRSAEKPQILY